MPEERMTLTHRCACGGVLNRAWDGTKYVIRCGKNKDHKEFVKQGDPELERFEGWRGRVPDEQVEAEIEHYLVKKGARRMVQEFEGLGEDAITTLAKYEGVTSLTRAQARTILKTCWPQAPEVDVVKAELTCVMYQLNPLAKHLYLIPFTNKETGEVTYTQVLGIGATRLIARRAARKVGGYSFTDGPRIMTGEEQTSIRGAIEPENWWAITVLKDGKGNTVPGYGSWPKNKSVKGGDKGNSPQNMAFIRSERNALDRLFPGEMPSGVEVMDETYLPSPLASQPSLPPPSHVEVEVKVKGKVEGKVEAGELEEKDIQNLGQLYQAVWNRWKMQPADIWKAMGYSNQRDYQGTLWQAYLTIKELKGK